MPEFFAAKLGRNWKFDFAAITEIYGRKTARGFVEIAWRKFSTAERAFVTFGAKKIANAKRQRKAIS